MAGTRQIRYRLMVDWDFNGTYTDESAYLQNAEGDMRLSPVNSSMVSGSGIVSSATFTLRNASGRFSPLRTDGALYTYIRDGKSYHAPCYFEVSINGGTNYSRVFTGVLKLPQETTLTTLETPTVRFDARSVEEQYLQQRVSLTQAQMAAIYDDGATEADIISTYLQLAGVAVGDMTFDAGLLVIPWAWMDDESAIEECWALAAACGGRFFADPDGEFVYHNMAHWQTATRSTAVQYSFTRDTLANFALRLDDSDLYNAVTVEASPRTIGAQDVIWEPDAPPVIAPGETKKLTARYDAPAYSIWGIQHSAYDQGGNDRTSSVTITATYYAQRADLVIVNASTLQVLVKPLRILGVPVIGGPENEERRTSADDGGNGAWWTDRGERSLAVRGNPYIQTAAHAGTLAQFLLDRCEYPRLTAAINAPGQPGLRLGDRIQVTDAITATAAFTGYVTGVRWSYGFGAFQQSIEAISTTGMYAYDGQYFIIGTHAANGTAKLFY